MVVSEEIQQVVAIYVAASVAVDSVEGRNRGEGADSANALSLAFKIAFAGAKRDKQVL